MPGPSANQQAMPSKPYNAVLFDRGTTLVTDYKAADFQPILQLGVAGMAAIVSRHGRLVDIESTYRHALRAN